MSRGPILDFVRAWLQATASTAGALADYQVLRAPFAGPRPSSPYLLASVTYLDAPVGLDEGVAVTYQTVTVTAAIDLHAYSLDVNATTITYTSDADATVGEVAAGLAAAIEADGQIHADASGGVVRVWSRGAPFTLANLDAALTASVQVPAEATRGTRRAGVAVQGFGTGTDDWLERANAFLRDPEVQRTVLREEDGVEGISLTALGGLQVLDAMVDTAIGERYLREYDCVYDATWDPVPQIEPTIEADLELRRPALDPDPEPLIIDQTITP